MKKRWLRLVATSTLVVTSLLACTSDAWAIIPPVKDLHVAVVAKKTYPPMPELTLAPIQYCNEARALLPYVAQEYAIAANVVPGYDTPKVQAEYDRWIAHERPFLNARLAKCNNAKDRNRISATLHHYLARIEHTVGDDWRTDLNLSLQQYTKCAVDYFAKREGAQCQTAIDEVAHDKVKWSAETP